MSKKSPFNPPSFAIFDNMEKLLPAAAQSVSENRESVPGWTVVRRKLCLNFLNYGKIDAILTEYFSAEYYTRNNSDYKIIYEPIMENHIAVAFRQTDTDLCSEINTALQQLKDNGKLEEIAKCWGVNKKISAN